MAVKVFNGSPPSFQPLMLQQARTARFKPETVAQRDGFLLLEETSSQRMRDDALIQFKRRFQAGQLAGAP
jgi:hypothetical protein